MTKSDFYLASGSPRRKELLLQLGYQFDIVRPDIAEQQMSSESAADYVQRLSLQKAQAGQTMVNDDKPVLGSDTIVVVDNQVLEKPENYQDAERMLMLLSNRQHQVMTAVSVVDKQQQQTCLVVTDVWFKPLTKAEIQAYWHSGEPCDKAGSYAIQGLGGRFVTRISGSYHAVVGLPLYQTDQLLQQFLSLKEARL